MGIETFPWFYFVVLVVIIAVYAGVRYYKK